MPETLTVLLVGAATLAVIGLAVSYIFTALRRKKVKCPQCGAKTPVAGAYYTDEVSGKPIPGEADIPFGMVSASARILIGFIAIVYVFVMLFSALGYENCDLQGISMLCSDSGSEQAGLAVNLVYSLIGIVGGVIVIFNGYVQLSRALLSRGKVMTYEYICVRDHSWTE